jgi:adiponectin receptor
MLPAANTPKWRPCRAYIFIALGISAAIPFFYLSYIMPDHWNPYIINSWNISPYETAGAIYIGGAICYALKFPEKWFPCKFDLIG